ncbi:MAG TPA: PIG-L family deacetylase [Chloroflexia bacterium]|nr:PIG-L family deacetylase [Chloroflexia bacterium]
MAVKPIGWSRVLVFGAHPDDEIIGCGGTLARLAAEGAHTVVVTFTDGGTGYSKLEEANAIVNIRQSESQASAKVLGVKELINLGFPTQALVNNRETYQKVVQIIRSVRPDVIFCHYKEDKHRDHQTVAAVVDEARWKATENAQPDLGQPWYTPQLFFYEIHDLFTHPSILVDTSDFCDKKIEALETQKSQLEVLPGVISYCKSLAQARGYLAGTQYAEAFLASNLLPQLL